MQREVEYTLEKIKICIDNESAWNYLRGCVTDIFLFGFRIIFLFHSLLLHEKNGLSQCPSVTKFCEDLYAEGNRSTFLLALLVDMCEEQCSVMGSSGDGVYTLARAQELCTALASEYDTIRAKYWEHVASNIVQKCENSNGAS